MAENHNDHIEYYKKIRKRTREDKRQGYKIRNSE